MLYGHLQGIVLRSLDRAPLSGYQLIKHVKDTVGWKPSTGSVYPLLDMLRKKGLVTVRPEGRRRVYSITAEGRDALGALVCDRDTMLVRMTEELNALQATSKATPEVAAMLEFIAKVRDGAHPMRQFEPELTELKRQFIISCVKESNVKEIKAILRDTTHRLRKVGA